MSTVSQTATLTVSSGPDRGTTFRLSDEMAHIGRGADRQVALTDPQIAELHASIACRNGRYALYALTDMVRVDDSAVPPERWVWLPESARIQLTPRTTVQFTYQAAAGAPGDDDSGPTRSGTFKPPRLKNAPPAAKPAPSARPAAKPAGKKETAHARFITDQQGDTLVKLGEDGHLPELALSEGAKGKPTEKNKAGGPNPLLVYGAVALSFVLSIGLLLIDTEPSNVSQQERSIARRQMTEYYGEPGQPLKPYQRLLREAQLAHARGDAAAEERAYRAVLTMLNSEDFNRPADPTRTVSLTGDPKSDERLRRLIAVLLSR